MKGEPEVSSTNRPASSDSDHKPGGTVLKLVGMRDWISSYYITKALNSYASKISNSFEKVLLAIQSKLIIELRINFSLSS